MDKWLLIEVVATLSATGVLMWFIRRLPRLGDYASPAAGLAGIAFLCALYALGLPSAGYILAALIALMALAYLLGNLLE